MLSELGVAWYQPLSGIEKKLLHKNYQGKQGPPSPSKPFSPKPSQAPSKNPAPYQNPNAKSTSSPKKPYQKQTALSRNNEASATPSGLLTLDKNIKDPRVWYLTRRPWCCTSDMDRQNVVLCFMRKILSRNFSIPALPKNFPSNSLQPLRRKQPVPKPPIFEYRRNGWRTFRCSGQA